ncbi:type III secretion system export apparatus subunit SctT [uncultured Mailhella sp.]|uniref:type III secretion system export apparatus subunit SctT n=1 Tax=uncultured Mailhella sp. TaxID=1981031 RepID=UPI0025EF9C2E|nr:type III secretion system export apparatus subunit SctT [uncultured Mailhella sp.]
MDTGLFWGYSLQEHLLAFLLGTPRLFMLMQTAPFMGGTLVTGQLRFTIVLACYLVLHPMLLAQIPLWEGLSLASGLHVGALIAKEVFLGMLMGFLVGMMFWTIQCAGFFIDNQRGAGQATETDPLAGEQTSPTGSFFFQSAVYVFFSTGAFLTFLGVVYASYEFWPVASLLPSTFFQQPTLPLFFAKKVSDLALDMVLLSGPVVVACLLTDISLGLINRFASQLNVYVLAMPVKSGLASLLLIFYFSMLMTGAVSMFDSFGSDLRYLQVLLP